MPILARFLPTDTTLLELSLERLDPKNAPRLERYAAIRRLAYGFMMALPAYFLGALVELVELRVRYHYPIPPFFWIREVALFAFTSWIAYEMYHVELIYRRFGL